MSEQKEKKYVGNGTQSGEFYVNISLKKSQLEPHYYEYNGEQYVRLTIGKLKEEKCFENKGRKKSKFSLNFKLILSKPQIKLISLLNQCLSFCQKLGSF